MKKLIVLCLVLGACTTAPEVSTTGDATVPTTTAPPIDVADVGYPDPPQVETGPLDPSIDNEIGSLIASIQAGGFDSEALDAVGAGGDPRVAWFLADLLRFFEGGSSGTDDPHSVGGATSRPGRAWSDSW